MAHKIGVREHGRRVTSALSDRKCLLETLMARWRSVLERAVSSPE